MEDNGLKKSSQVVQIVLAIVTTISLLFGGGAYVLTRVSEVDKKIEIESERRRSLEKVVEKIDEKLDKIIEMVRK